MTGPRAVGGARTVRVGPVLIGLGPAGMPRISNRVRGPQGFPLRNGAASCGVFLPSGTVLPLRRRQMIQVALRRRSDPVDLR